MNRIFDSGCMGQECIVSQQVLGGSRVGSMYRQRPLEPGDSGWRFFTGQESAEYLEYHTVRAQLDDVCACDQTVRALLDSVWGSEYCLCDGRLQAVPKKRNYRRIVNKITARIGPIDHVEKRENGFPMVMVQSAKILISLCGQPTESERMICYHASRPGSYQMALLDAVTKSGAMEGDIVLCDGEDRFVGGILRCSGYGSWIKEVCPIDAQMLAFAKENGTQKLMMQLPERS